MSYVLLHSTSRDTFSVSRNADSIRGARVCSHCYALVEPNDPVDVVVQECSSGRTGLRCSFGVDVGFASKRLVEALPKVVRSCLVLGCVISEDKGPLDEVVTFWCPFRAVIRGQHEAGFRYCPECGALLYFAMGRRYLSPAPEGNPVVCYAGHGRILVRDDSINVSQFPKFYAVGVEPIPILDVPLDGLGNIKSSSNNRRRQPRQSSGPRKSNGLP